MPAFILQACRREAQHLGWGQRCGALQDRVADGYRMFEWMQTWLVSRAKDDTEDDSIGVISTGAGA
jgi:hypothetical protein